MFEKFIRRGYLKDSPQYFWAVFVGRDVSVHVTAVVIVASVAVVRIDVAY